MALHQWQNKLLRFRRELHRHPELSGQEEATAGLVYDFLQPTAPDRVYRQLGGHGLALAYDSGKPGPVVMFRAELDALPIPEANTFPHASAFPEVSHKCGHDGHMAILAGLGWQLSAQRPGRGSAILLFQPAEETGQGALRVLQDPAWQHIQPDYLFALHNIPGLPQHQVCSRPQVFAAASRGMTVTLKGATAHAAHPEQGNSPAAALSAIMQQWDRLCLSPDFQDFVLLTIVHAQLGEPAFGITPGYAELRATLRSFEPADMARLVHMAEASVQQTVRQYGLQHTVGYSEVFHAVANNADAYQHILQAAHRCGLDFQLLQHPFRWSEDFGYFSSCCKTAFFGLGAGETQPVLHHASYDFPDEIITTGTRMFWEIARQFLCISA